MIQEAFYGDLPDGRKTDVTAKVAGSVEMDSLSIQASNKIFGDPASGVGKKLTVNYTFDGKPHSKTVDEGKTLVISEMGD